MMFATGSFLRLLLSEEVAEIDSMKMSEHVLTRLHSFGEKKNVILPGKTAQQNQKSVMKQNCHLLPAPDLSQIHSVTVANQIFTRTKVSGQNFHQCPKMLLPQYVDLSGSGHLLLEVLSLYPLPYTLFYRNIHQNRSLPICLFLS